MKKAAERFEIGNGIHVFEHYFANEKILRSEDYNYRFNRTTGRFDRWGKKFENDPDFGLPEIADIEVTTKCKGAGGKLCKFCYKGNTPHGDNMSLDTFKKIFHKLPRTLTQIAFGADAQAEANPDLFNMMRYCRNNDYQHIVPNITVADISDETADNLAKVCGAVAVSWYGDGELCMDSVEKLTNRGMNQVNIHMMISEETFDDAKTVIDHYVEDERLNKLNAIVFLSLKQRGRGENFTPLTQEKFKELVDYAFQNDAPLGFDSCSAPKFLEAVKDHEQFEQFKILSEPCESTLFSTYINTYGKFFPCSFAEGIGEWKEGLDIVDCENFLEDIWFNPKTQSFRDNLIDTAKCNELDCRTCPLFEV